MRTDKKPIKQQPETSRDYRREMALKNNAFNRFMLLRYSLAIFFFANLYWFLILLGSRYILLLLPLILLLLMIRACVEQFKLYGSQHSCLLWSKRAFAVQGVAQVVLLIYLGFAAKIELLFPVFANTLTAKSVLIALQLLGFGLVYYNIKRINQIQANKDKYYYRFQTIKKYL